MDVAVAVQPDGNARVTERFTVRALTASSSSFRRQVPAWKHDGVSLVTTPVPARIASGAALDVTWPVAQASGAPQDLELSYQAANVVEISGIRGLVSWKVLPAHRDWDAAEVSIRVDLPGGAVLLDDPWVEEPGWTVARLPHGLTATRAFVPASESATAGIEFTIDRMAASTPRWQSDREFAEEFIPAFIAAALFILVTGAGILIMLRIKHPPVRVRPAGIEERAPEPEVPPALRLALMRGRPRGDRAELTAAVTSLVGQGLIELEDDTVVATDPDRDVWAHEEAVLAGMPRAGGTPLDLPAAFRRVNRAAYRRGALEDLVQSGLADRDRVTVARDLFRAGLATMVFGVLVWAAAALAITQFGAWPLLVPWSILIVGLAFVAVSSRYGVLTESGARVRMLYFARVRDGRTSE